MRCAACWTPRGALVVIDHHASNPGFGELNWIDPDAEAAVVLVAELIDELGEEITSDVAANLYAGLATDTANFRFATERAHQLAARLLETGIRPAEVLRPIVDTHPFRWLSMLATVMAGASLDRDAAGGAGLVTVPITLRGLRRGPAGGAGLGDRHRPHRRGGRSHRRAQAERRRGLAGVAAVAQRPGHRPARQPARRAVATRAPPAYTYHGRLDDLLTQLHAALATVSPSR